MLTDVNIATERRKETGGEPRRTADRQRDKEREFDRRPPRHRDSFDEFERRHERSRWIHLVACVYLCLYMDSMYELLIPPHAYSLVIIMCQRHACKVYCVHLLVCTPLPHCLAIVVFTLGISTMKGGGDVDVQYMGGKMNRKGKRNSVPDS